MSGSYFTDNTRGFAGSFWAKAERDDAKRREEKFDLAERFAAADAGDAALRALAELRFPEELKSAAERWRMSEFMREVFVRAYKQGWKDAHHSQSLGGAQE